MNDAGYLLKKPVADLMEQFMATDPQQALFLAGQRGIRATGGHLWNGALLAGGRRGNSCFDHTGEYVFALPPGGIVAEDGSAILAWHRCRTPNKRTNVLRLYLPGHSEPVSEVPIEESYLSGQTCTFVPQAGILAFTRPRSRSVYLLPYDVRDVLASLPPQLYVASVPPCSAQRGQRWSYRIRLVGGHKARYQLDFGPKGMAMSADGLMEWPVPQNAAREGVDVIVRMTDAADTIAYHKFRILVK
jgi:hypothetical protein